MDIRIGPQALERPLLFLVRSRTDCMRPFALFSQISRRKASGGVAFFISYFRAA